MTTPNENDPPTQPPFPPPFPEPPPPPNPIQKQKSHVYAFPIHPPKLQTDDVCTDIIHYEEQKLVAYHGNLSAFVAKRPDAKHYYELSTETLK